MKTMVPLRHRKKNISQGAHSAKRLVRWLPAAGVGFLLTIGSVVTLPDGAFARQLPPPPELPMKPAQSPIDGGLTLLAAAGGGYAIKKLRDKKK